LSADLRIIGAGPALIEGVKKGVWGAERACHTGHSSPSVSPTRCELVEGGVEVADEVSDAISDLADDTTVSQRW